MNEAQARIQALANAIENSGREGYRPLGRTAAVIDAALGQEPVAFALGSTKGSVDVFSGELLVVAESIAAHVALTDAVTARAGYANREGNVRVTAVPRSSLRSVRLHALEHQVGTGDDPIAMPWAVNIELEYEPLDGTVTFPLNRMDDEARHQVIAALLTDARA